MLQLWFKSENKLSVKFKSNVRQFNEYNKAANLTLQH